MPDSVPSNFPLSDVTFWEGILCSLLKETMMHVYFVSHTYWELFLTFDTSRPIDKNQYKSTTCLQRHKTFILHVAFIHSSANGH